ncbi:MAG TPA: MFS transporter [Candidatus Kapabacteria bacterium]|nr:MFS transporter [Candidatus Kapabacteria bacterium]
MFKKELVPIFIVVFVSLLGFSIILPLLPFYAKTFGMSPELTGILVGSYSFAQFFAGPILGSYSDRVGRRPVLLFSQVLAMFGYVLLAFAPSAIFLFIARIIDGLGGGAVTIAQAYIADTTEPKERSGAMAVIGIAFGLGFMVGPLLGGLLAANVSNEAPALFAAGLCGLSTLLTLTYLKEPRTHKASAVRSNARFASQLITSFKRPRVGTLLGVFLFFSLPFSLFVSMFSLFAHTQFNYTAEEVSYFLAFVGFMGILWQGGAIRPMVKRFGELTSMRIAFVALVVGFIVTGASTETWHLIVAGIISSFGSGLIRPTLSSLITQVVPEDQKGSILGISSSIESATRAVAPVLGGYLIGGLHPNWLGYAAAILTAIGTYLAFKVTFDSREINGEMIVD